MFLLLAGCFAGYWTTSSSDYAVGDDHDVTYPADQTFVLTQDVLRGQGILFDTKPDNQIITMWKPADTPASVWASLVGVEARYRYEIQVVPEGSHRSKIVANVRAEDIADNEIDSYRPTRRLGLFKQFDELAAKLPPPPTTPGSGGVNFALLPGENLTGLAKRVTGSADNWQQIAKDNGLKSPTDTAGVQSVWVSDHLLPQSIKSTPAHREGGE